MARLGVCLAMVGIGVTGLISGCTANGGTASSASTSQSPWRSTLSSHTGAASPASGTAHRNGTFDLTGDQAREVSHLVRFIAAYNAGDVQAALAQFSPTQSTGFSDCDYATQRLIDGRGRARIAGWLRKNGSLHDHRTIGDIFDANPDQPLGVLGVSFSRRSSDAIVRAGYPDGITPKVAAKVRFDRNGLITEFGAGPYGGSSGDCHIR